MKPNTRMSTLLAATIVPVLAVCLAACATVGHDHEPTVKTATGSEIRAFFQGAGKTVVTFVGYSGAGYENPAAMLAAAEQVLSKYDPKTTIVNIGATEEGIGAIYELAEHRDFPTAGIVSTQAKKVDAKVAAHCDYVFYVEDETWGGFLKGTETLSPTSAAMVENSTVIIAIGGGEVARDELIAAKRAGKKVQFIPADMNHQLAIEAAGRKGLPPPTDFRGAAQSIF